MYVVSTLERTGPTRQLLYLSTKMQELGHRVWVLTLSPEPKDSLKAIFLDQGVEVLSLNVGRLKSLFVGRARLRKLVADKAVEVVHTQGIRADGLVSGLDPAISRVATLRNYPFEDYPPLYGKLKGWLMAWFHLRALTDVGRVAVVSGSIARSLETNGKLQVEVVHNSVDSQLFCAPSSEERVQSRANLALHPDAFVVVIVGDLIRRKRVPELLLALGRLKARLDVLVVGDGPELDSCKAAVGISSTVRFLGKCEDVRPALWASDVFISNSASEGMPNAVMEAIATGLPCILSDISAHCELVTVANASLPEVTFFSLDKPKQGSVDQLKEGFDAVNDYWLRTGQRRSCDAFSVDAMAEKYCSLYRQGKRS
ncbi:glycosyltransferase family 4 protein [Marinobacter nauticus]|uniref:glycosyltransferase family 4 protein n=1 Tax=Marinobacter nauticus TaxID=2743 RepID=UPI0022871221|nr:glycosyltransferase family 4 protein [Marinobacter nauticus]